MIEKEHLERDEMLVAEERQELEQTIHVETVEEERLRLHAM